MQDYSDLTPEEKSLVDWMKRPTTLNKRKAEQLIDDLEEAIAVRREKIKTATSRVEKNILYSQIDGRKDQIKYAEQFLN